MKNAKKNQLKQDLLKQMRDKENNNSQKEEKSSNKNFMGFIDKFGYSNIDQKAMIIARSQKKEKQKREEYERDKRMLYDLVKSQLKKYI